MVTKKEYNIGLDIGTNSVGWAVVEENNQKILRKGNKFLWGVRLFDEANSAENRRTARSTRRRYDRRRERINLLQKEFSVEMDKVDSKFFNKLKESKYHETDKLNKTITLTNEEKEQLRNYQNKYKTIYHLRNELVTNTNKMDIRLVYLALHHIIKYRGNFLYQNSEFNVNSLDILSKLRSLFENLYNYHQDLGIPDDYENFIDFKGLEEALLSTSSNDMKAIIKSLLEDITGKYFATEFGKLMSGNKASIDKMFSLELENKVEIKFSGTDYEDKYEEYQSVLDENILTLDLLNDLYNTIFLKKIFKGSDNTSISSLMVSFYETHNKDLKLLKKVLNADRFLYDKMFRTKKEMCIYERYISNKIDFDELKKEINNLLNKLDNNNDVNIVITKLEAGTFLPRITSTDNGKYPYQLNKAELIRIIENQGKYYPFLLDTIGDNKTYKIVKLLEFKIPYYVGPLVSDNRSKFAWFERKIDNVKISPYNFDEIVDKEKTAEKFIKRMISHCSYLLDEYALANNSILYSKYKVMNELKQIKVNGRKLELPFQQKLLNEFFTKTNGTITEKKFKNYLVCSGEYNMEAEALKITGYSAENKFANNMQSYIDFFGDNGIFLNTNYSVDDAEQIIEWITIFEDKDILEKKVRDNYKELSEQQILKILSRKYSGWGNLSKKLLTTKYYEDKQTENFKSIMDLLFETEENFMQILNNDNYKFQKMIQENNNIEDVSKINYSVVDSLATSPATKRGIFQSLKVVDEIVNYIGYEPKNIIIEMARSDEEKVRKDTRKDYLKKLYDVCKNTIEDYKKLKHELDSHEVTNQRMFLYFIQEGKCLYSGEKLNIEDIENQSLYEIDHIIPRTLIKDDSIDNKALVLRKCNQVKKANYVLPFQYRNEKQKAWWKHLKDSKLISAKKFHNLIRDKYTDTDIEGFINRQLVETRQITKHVANILKNYHKDSKVIYLKADISHNYREKYDLFKFRDINDYHHAHDAYLAAVLGEYKEKFMKNKINFDMIKELNDKIVEMDDGKKKGLKYGYLINSLDENLSDIVYQISDSFINRETGEILFDAKEFNERVENTLYRNDILISKKVEYKTGELFNQTKNKKGGPGVPLKANMPVELYGAYTRLNPAYAVLAKINKKGKESQKLVGFPIYLIGKSNEVINEYYKNLLGLSDKDTLTLSEKRIPFYTLLNWDGQICSLVGASSTVEVCNALEFNIDKEFMKNHKYALKKLYDNKYREEVNDYDLKLNEIITYIVDEIDARYKLYSNLVEELKSIVKYNDYSDISVENKEKIIKELFNLLKFNSVNANFKFLSDKYSSAFGKKCSRTIEHATIISKSITGIKESKNEF